MENLIIFAKVLILIWVIISGIYYFGNNVKEDSMTFIRQFVFSLVPDIFILSSAYFIFFSLLKNEEEGLITFFIILLVSFSEKFYSFGKFKKDGKKEKEGLKLP